MIARQKKNCKFTTLFIKAMFERERISPAAQFAILLGLVGAGIFIGGIITIFIAASYLHVSIFTLAGNVKLIESNVGLSRILQAVGSFFMIAVPAIVFAFIVERKRAIPEMGFTNALSGKQMLFIVLIGVAAIWVSDGLGIFNEWIPLPKNSETYFKKLEKTYDDEAVAILTMKSASDYIISLIVIALLPALFEEMLFRGCLQKIMISWTRNAFIGILIASILFSAFHASYYGFLPRLFLGIVLGYIYYYSKNIWLNITMHFLNNAFQVTAIYSLARNGQSAQDALSNEKIPVLNILLFVAMGTVALYFLFGLFKKESELVISMKTLERMRDDNDPNNLL